MVEKGGSDGSISKFEFLVRMSGPGCAKSVRKLLEDDGKIKVMGIDFGAERVVVETTKTSQHVQDLIEGSGRLAVLQGVGGRTANDFGAAVTILNGNGVSGVARFIQAKNNECIVEATIDGLSPAQSNLLKIHEYGDLSDGCKSCGEVFSLANSQQKYNGLIGKMSVSAEGRGELRTVLNSFSIWNFIGRSLVLHSSNSRISCGIIARSPGMFQNPKRICACDGKTVWDERVDAKSSL